MGFLNPGKTSKRKRSSGGTLRVKRAKKSSSPGITISESSLQSEEPEREELQREQEKQDTRSILDRLPVEILLKIFIMCGEPSLPLVNKHIHHALRSSPSLRMAVFTRFIHDLNRHLPQSTTPDDHGYDIRYVLDSSVLDYKFISSSVLEQCHFDAIMPHVTIQAETQQRLIRHYDRLNKTLLERMYANDADPLDIANELTRMADERDMMDFDIDDAVLPNDTQLYDFPKRWYTRFEEDDLRVMEILYEKRMRFKQDGVVLANAIDAECSLVSLERVLKLTEKRTVTNVKPLISSLRSDRLELIDWVLSHQGEGFDLINHDDLWIWITESQRIDWLKELTRRGANPSHGIIGMILR